MPYIFVNMAITLDGKIAPTGGEDFSLGSEADRQEMDRLRSEADIVLWGGETLRVARYPARIRDSGLIAKRKESGFSPQPANGVITQSGQIPEELPWFEPEEVARIIFTSAEGASEANQAARGRAEVVTLGEKEFFAFDVLAHLEERGIERVLIEGGGGIHWMFAREGLVDVLHVTVTPWLAGGVSAPTLLDGEGFPAGGFTQLKLEEMKQVGDEIFLRYRVNK